MFSKFRYMFLFYSRATPCQLKSRRVEIPSYIDQIDDYQRPFAVHYSVQDKISWYWNKNDFWCHSKLAWISVKSFIKFHCKSGRKCLGLYLNSCWLKDYYQSFHPFSSTNFWKQVIFQKLVELHVNRWKISFLFFTQWFEYALLLTGI